MNSIVLTGRLVAKPELRKTTNGRSMCPFSIACNNINNEVDYIDCIAWGKQAENLCQYQEKGNMIGIDGRLTTNTYENKEGYKIKKCVVSANNIEFLTPRIKNANIVNESENSSANPFEEFGQEIEIDNNFLE